MITFAFFFVIVMLAKTRPELHDWQPVPIRVPDWRGEPYHTLIGVATTPLRSRVVLYLQGFPAGRGSAWLERLVRDQEVGGSNPLAPTSFSSSPNPQISTVV